MKKKVPKIKNMGPICTAELESIGITSTQQIQSLGWEEVFLKYISFYPNRLNLNLLTALIGAEYDQDWRKIDPELKAQAKNYIKKLKSTAYNTR